MTRATGPSSAEVTAYRAPQSPETTSAQLSRSSPAPPLRRRRSDSLLVGSPGEDIDGDADAGRVYLITGAGAEGGEAYDWKPVGITSMFGPQEHEHFGAVLSHANAS